MADYHPLIARAVAGLDKNTGENRRALYERARTALVAQLRGVTPPLEESEITRERLALEEAIRKVEAESARHAREVRPPLIRRSETTRRAETPRREEPPQREETPRRTETPRATPAAARSSPATTPSRGQAGSGTTTAPKMPGSQAAPASAASQRSQSEAQTQPQPQAQQPAGGAQRSLSDEALKGFRDVVTDPKAEFAAGAVTAAAATSFARRLRSARAAVAAGESVGLAARRHGRVAAGRFRSRVHSRDASAGS
jgi:hypothetical protein